MTTKILSILTFALVFPVVLLLKRQPRSSKLQRDIVGKTRKNTSSKTAAVLTPMTGNTC